jgi:hypothetical protein
VQSLIRRPSSVTAARPNSRFEFGDRGEGRKEHLMSDAQVVVNVSKEIIDAHVKAAVVSALGRDPSTLIKAVVDAAMREPDRNGYGRGTIWDTEVNKMIREVALQTFNEWLNEMKPTIAKEVRARLAGKNGTATINDIVEKLTGALRTFRVDVRIGE